MSLDIQKYGQINNLVLCFIPYEEIASYKDSEIKMMKSYERQLLDIGEALLFKFRKEYPHTWDQMRNAAYFIAMNALETESIDFGFDHVPGKTISIEDVLDDDAIDKIDEGERLYNIFNSYAKIFYDKMIEWGCEKKALHDACQSVEKY